MKFNSLILLFVSLFFLVSCDDGIKFNNPNDPNADISDSQNYEDKDSTDTVADEDSNEQADTENDENSDPNDTTPDDADPTDDNSDSADDEDTIDPDVTDTGETVGETRVTDCTGLPENAGWNTVSAIVQTWNGEKWVPSSVASFNLEGSEDECRFKCDTNYGWNGSICSADVKNAYCDAKPENSVWNDGGRNGTFAQTWNGSSWTPASHAAVYSKSATECGFVCATGYIWDGSVCEVAPTQTVECTGLPMNGAEWNTASTITQTWNGEKWIPESTVGVYNENPSTDECRFKCKDHYSWKNSECVADKKNSPCMNLPTNAQWNTVNSIEQTWSGSDWQPSTTGVYNESASTTECRFVCKTNYKWNASTSKCDPETNVANCTGKPANSLWNGSGKFTQTWTDSGWYPSTYEATYNKTAGICTFVCDTGFIWDETSCVSAPTREAGCQDKPANTVWNTVDKITQTYNGADWEPSTTPSYNEEASDRECRFKCASAEYSWNGSACQSGSSGGSKSLGNICTGQNKCYNASEEITCPTSSYDNFYGQDAQYTNKCTPQSFSSSTNVVVDNNTGLTWEKSPSESSYTWDDAPNHCTELNSSNYGGKSNWRVPNPLEFMTIVDNSTYNPATNSNFTNMPTDSSGWIWTSAEYKGNTSHAYVFIPYYGKSYGNPSDFYLKTHTYKVLCVSGDEMQPATSADFTAQTISGNVVVTDSKTGLMWQKEYATSKTWQQALKYCEDSTYAGYSDWRLPNKNELASLINYEKSGYPYSYFPDMPSDSFWSSSTCVLNTINAWYVYFYFGGVHYDYKTNKYSHNYYVRCVR